VYLSSGCDSTDWSETANWLYYPVATIYRPTSNGNSQVIQPLPSAKPITGWQKNVRIPPQLFQVFVFATRIPGVLADTGGDFSNNLFSDIALFLALFGDQVARQYMSHSLSWNEDLIFAIAPLGIITAITSAIRVGGPSSFKAIIGRAREGKGVVEVELMSSTSHDVCELWNGDRVARILGTKEPPSVIELLYSEDSNSNNPEPQVRQKHYQAEIYSFESGKLAGVIIPKDRQSVPSSKDTEIKANEPPNLGLNIGGQWVSDLELKAIAMVGIILQGGVLAFAGISEPLSLDSKLEKNHKPVRLYSFSLMAAGTVGLIVGMFLCANIIERSTAETTWTVVNPRINTVSWLQRSTVVNDQQFDSYFIQRQEQAPGRSHFYKILSYALPTKWLNANPQLQIRKSRKAETNKQQTLTIIATSISVSAFVLQFIGLRGLNGSVTIAQLIVTGVMTVLRAVVRRGLVADEVRCEKLQKGYELDRVAIKITNCYDWYVITGGLQPTTEIRYNELATKVVNARVQLGNLCKWETQWEATVAATAASIEAVMNFLCKSDDVRLIRLSDVFVWKLVVQVRSESESFEEIRLQMSRTWHDGRGWSDWNVDKSILEAVLGLWMLHYRDQTAAHESLRFLDIKRETYERWIQRQAEDTDDSGRINDWSGCIFGKPITEDSSNLVKVISDAPINKICGQYILSKFMSQVAEKYLVSIGGRVWIRSGQLGVKASFGWSNTVLDDLANEVKRTGLATIEEAFLSIIPPIEKAKKLPTDIDISAAARTREISMSSDGQFHPSPAQLSAEIPGRYLEKDPLQRGLEKIQLNIKGINSVIQKSETALEQESQFQKPVIMSKYVHSNCHDSVGDFDHEGALQVEPEGTSAAQIFKTASEFLRSVNVQDMLLQKFTTEFSLSSLRKETMPSGKEPATMESSITPAGDASLWPVMFMDGKSDITFEKTNRWSISDQVKCWIEDQLHTAIVWWPLAPPRRPIKPEFSRVVWTCVSNWFI